MLPVENEPPITTISRMRSTISGAMTKASAILVSGAIQATDTGSGDFRSASIMAGTACSSDTVVLGGGSLAPPRPSLP